jgi:hypothetical protein
MRKIEEDQGRLNARKPLKSDRVKKSERTEEASPKVSNLSNP